MFELTTHTPIDLSIGIEANVQSEPWPPEIQSYDHAEGAALLAERLQEHGFDIEAEDFPGGIGLGWEQITAITHAATHMDAPSHYGPTVGGESAMSINEIPLEWTMGSAVVLDFTWKEPGGEISKLDIEDQLAEIGHDISTGDIVLLETGADELWGQPEYLTEFPGMGAAATRYLVDQGVRVIGTDAYGFDKPFAEMATRYVDSDDNSELWPAHFAGRDVSYCQIEKMANLDALPRRTGIPLIAQPVKIQNASAGWVRPIAFINNE
jgi:kynurenine formamidase